MKCDKNPKKIQSMFDEISSGYDLMNNFISLGTHFVIKFITVLDLKIKHNANILDLCCGTGDFTKIISKVRPDAKVIGLDFSKNMIKLAKTKNPNGVFMQGDCTDMPFKNNEFDYITMGFGLRNIENRDIALEQIYRVLKQGGYFLHLDFGRQVYLSNIFDFIVLFWARIFKKNFEHYQYLLNSRKSFPEPDALICEFNRAGFKVCRRHDFLFGIISAQILKK